MPRKTERYPLAQQALKTFGRFQNKSPISLAEYFAMQIFICYKIVCISQVRIVAQEPNLREIEKKAYMSYHQDGLLDIFTGVYILGFGLGIWADITLEYGFGSIMPAILIATILPIWIAAKRKITMPRIGFVKFRTGGTAKVTAIFLGLMVVGLGVFLVFTLAASQSGLRHWLDLIFQNGMLVVGFGSLAVCVLFGHSMGLNRLYAYGLLAFVLLVIGHFIGAFFGYILLILGAAVMAAGFALLISFVRKYPPQGDKAIAD
jgi:hypothetical protein